MRKTLLLVEDSEDDAFFILRAFKSVGVMAPIPRVDDGRKAIEYLTGSGGYADRLQYPLPALVLLDLQLPLVSGLEVLQWIRREAPWPNVPVVIFSSSRLESDVEKAYALGACSFLVKPNDLADFGDIASLIKRYWLDLNVLAPPAKKPLLASTCA